MADLSDTDADLPTLIRRKDHLNVLRYIRVHKIRDATLVLKHGKALLGDDLSGKISNEVARLAALEQICLAALDQLDHETADVCLTLLRDSGGVAGGSARFRLLLGRCLEGANDIAGAENVYQELLSENPANLLAHKRLYCLVKSQAGKQGEAVQALNAYLKQNYADSAAWYEMAQLRMELGDYKSAAYCLEEVVLGGAPADAKLHCELAECYATVGGLENLGHARKHMAQSLELDPTQRRAQMGLVSIANAYLEEAQNASKKQAADAFEVDVAKELVKYGAEQVLKSYKGTELFSAVKSLMSEYTEDL